MAPELRPRRAALRQPREASMRPGPIGPGIGAGRDEHGAYTECFNEAGANWPRNSQRTSPPPAPPARFNEAGANWPRNCRSCAGCPRCRGASMRPGPIGPGISAESDDGEVADLASMRPGPIGPGIDYRQAGQEQRQEASMRPGPIGPGINRFRSRS